jgi:hypothetical protein
MGFFSRVDITVPKIRRMLGPSTHPRANLPIIVAEKARKASSAAGNEKLHVFFFNERKR